MHCVLQGGRRSLILSGLPNAVVLVVPFAQRRIVILSRPEPAPSSTTRNMSSQPEATAAMPPMMYGTAWKKERTADLVFEAIKAGFRGIDTAAMKKHYDEAGTGEGIRRAIREGIVSRKDLFIQTKFTPEDPSSPYSLNDPIPAQIHASITSSLANLSTPDRSPPYLDALVMHSPFTTIADTLEAWTALECYLPTSLDSSRRGKILRLGISNVTLPVLLALSDSTTRQPMIVQNRFRAAERSWDRDIRTWCASTTQPLCSGSGSQEQEKVNYYQGFWTLTGNPGTWQLAGFVRELAEAAGISPAAAWYVLLMEADVVVLNGTSDAAHMREDLDARRKVEAFRRTDAGEEVWRRCWVEFKRLIGG
ncbi:NADP-dependent oxidoreductase domain-containing protein [Chaetomium strumarium]|uniref:NADP-dependent oxidoreductase domain-containing protein n=1 Tax=Chaetomium strumarium TaxID=1170767 RepID=A0AAJ0M0J8_9PEZI|nr:NADP-dependent oxidoreductase domain-containing protein [Chaetomium strumarium]